jgi:hypothetical protein
MFDMVLLSVLRCWHFRDGMPIREITRHTGLSRNTVRKYLASGELEPRYCRPKFLSKRDEYEQTLTSWLHRETKRPRKQRPTAKHLHQDLVQMLGHNWMQSNRNPHKHLFIADMGFTERLKDADDIQLITGSVPLDKWKALLEQGDPLIEGLTWSNGLEQSS